ncbi:MAG: nicotinate phosphoribosyltransferase [Phycisphaerales bacterium]|nr:MAG: nicotinate phosphoribosyltransferase [Phycisphaerales bacterium]
MSAFNASQLTNLALLTDLYQLTMAYGYWKAGVSDREAVFHLYFRENPFDGGFAVACGLEPIINLLIDFHFDDSDVEYLRTLTGNDGKPLFDRAFLGELRQLRLSCDIDATPEGTTVFPHEPLIRVRGPIAQCQILETPLLNTINFQTLIATKAARLRIAAGAEPILEFGLRRAQGIDGALAASRAAYVGGCNATSNILAGKLYGIPVRGTHAHSWVMCFESELEAFQAYADAMPNNCIFLVDTYDTLAGVGNAIEIGRRLKEGGHRMVGIRLDSGDLAYLSIEARRMLDEAGFPDAVIVASNDLDENIVQSLKEQGAKITVWGVGTKLATAYDQPAMGGVYKLSAVRPPGGAWEHKVKLSEQAIKVSNPGVQQVRRFRRDGEYIADAIYDELTGIDDDCTIVDPLDMMRRKRIPAGTRFEDLLVPVFRGGRCVYESPSIGHMRACAAASLAGFHSGVKRFIHPHQYPVGLDTRLHELKTRLVLQARGMA